MVAWAGAGPWPQITLGAALPASQIITGTSPPGPHRCGSTTCRVNATATPASKALPPRSSTPMPTAVPIQCVDATTPKVPSISGRVVNGPGLMLAIGVVLPALLIAQSTEVGGKSLHSRCRERAVPPPLELLLGEACLQVTQCAPKR